MTTDWPPAPQAADGWRRCSEPSSRCSVVTMAASLPPRVAWATALILHFPYSGAELTWCAELHETNTGRALSPSVGSSKSLGLRPTSESSSAGR